MAGADYYRCDVCGCKCFYDANLNWDGGYSETEVRGHDATLDNCGDIKAICVECSKTNEVVVQPLSA